MPSPRRIFANDTTEEIQAILAAARERKKSGAWISTNGGGKGSTRAFDNSDDTIFEASYELRLRGIGPALGPTRTIQNFAT